MTQKGTQCPEIEEGLRCRKALHVNPEGVTEDFHAGGHWFASDKTADLMARGHFDAKAMLSGETFTPHLPENCPDPQWCKDNFWTRS